MAIVYVKIQYPSKFWLWPENSETIVYIYIYSGRTAVTVGGARLSSRLRLMVMGGILLELPR